MTTEGLYRFAMHDIRFIRDNPDAFDEGLKKRGLAPLSAELIALDERRRTAIAALQAAQERRNALSKEIGQAKAKKDEARAQALMAEVAQLKDSAPQLEQAEREANAALEKALAEIPNTPLSDVPVGKDEHDNVERHRFGAPRDLATPKEHFEIGEAMGFMDFETAAKLSGSRFVVLRGQLARLERALGQFMLDLHTSEHGYAEVNPPLLVRDEVMFGTAQLPKFAEDQFATSRTVEDFKSFDQVLQELFGRAVKNIPHIIREYKNETGNELTFDEILPLVQATFAEQISEHRQQYEALKTAVSRLWLIPTAEVPLTNLANDTILSEDELPLRFTALTPCFRAEAGAAGKDTRGMLRQHQFTKCELVSITTPEQSRDEHERMLASAEEVLKRLDLPYRVMTLCTGDMGFASAKTYDIEVWLPGQGTYREISSCSVCTDFQARRMNARYRQKEEKGPRFVHTLNGSGIAVGRALIAVMENYQDQGGGIAVPEALAPYMGGLKRIEGGKNPLPRGEGPSGARG
jgi:seryl-tRNA synthetase